ncbi:MAG: 4-hydroxy-tetrahydrodipicolinate synthase [Eubacteriales bacterium]|nr:4-hydroxy-tetrahydrodipicolinate synthase [Eubacteriales bacterium]MDD3867573.1 4-hydroxy-tetrahydrodipicolinate synthase [Eubacteriales bacterium]MDD4461942.1 4-hydroxy-tetrahydrodipicolinate synthase [Eubacteriales bacterium]
MKKPIFTGAATAIITPFTHDGVDFDKLASFCEFQISHHIDAIVVAGTTGESSTMPDEEHLAVIRHVVETVNGRVPVIAGTGSNDTRHAVELSQKACRFNIDGLLCVTPYYNKTTQEGLYRHFKAVHDQTDKPIILYNVPSRTNLNIDPETIIRLAELPRINGIKECHLEQTADVMVCCQDNLNIYTGEDPMILPMLSLGGRGVISVISNVVPDLTHEITAAWFSGDTGRAAQLQIQLTPLIRALFAEVSPIPVKAALNLMGMDIGECRMPLYGPSPATLARIESVLRDLDLIGDAR